MACLLSYQMHFIVNLYNKQYLYCNYSWQSRRSKMRPLFGHRTLHNFTSRLHIQASDLLRGTARESLSAQIFEKTWFSRITSSIFYIRRMSVCIGFQVAEKNISARTFEISRKWYFQTAWFSRITSSIFYMRRMSACIGFQGADKNISACTFEISRNWYFQTAQFSRITSSLFHLRRMCACIGFQGVEKNISARTFEMIRNFRLLDLPGSPQAYFKWDRCAPV